MHKKLVLTSVLTLLAIAAGCSSGGSDTVGSTPEGQASLQGSMAAVILDSDTIVDGILDGQLGVLPATSGSSTAPATVNVSFSRTAPCPAGGEIMIEATLDASRDAATGVMEATFTGTRTLTDCAFVRGEHTITINGSATFEAFRRRVNGVPDGLQTTSYSGSFHAVRDDGAERFCDFNVEIVRDPAAGTRTINGTLCQNAVGQSVVWNPR
jgi:hypothetical protein